MTTSHKLLSSLTGKASVITFVLMVAGILFAAPSSAMAQQIALTPEELEQQNRLQDTIAATTRNLEQGEKEVNGVVFTPRWSNPVWVEADSLSILFVYCLPGEFAESGQEILGGSELEVLESYSLAVTRDLTGWLMVVDNENQTNRLPAAVGVICASDADDPETRILSQQEEIEINNIIRQFITIRNTVINNITQIINIINNVTRPPPTNNTGGGGNTTEPLTVQAVIDIDQDAKPVVVFEGSIDGGTPPYTCHWDLGDGTTSNACGVSHIYENPGTYTATITVTDSIGQTASDSIEGILITPPTGNGTGGNNTGGIPPFWHPPVIYGADDITVQAIGPEGGPVSFQVTADENLEGDTYTVPVSCDHESGETFPIGETLVTCTAIGTVFDNGQRHTTQESFTITVEELPADGPPPTTTDETGGQ
jgi:PKD repeat protein